MRKIGFLLLVVFLLGISAGFEILDDSLRAINPVSYSDVAYVSAKDTVVTSTLSGAIYQEIRGGTKRKLITRLADEINAIEFSAKRNWIFAATPSSGIFVIDYPSGKVIRNLKGGQHFLSLGIDDPGNLLAAGCGDGRILIWNMGADFTCDTLKGKSPAFAIAIYDNGSRLAAAGYSINLWDRRSKMIVKQLPVGDAHAIRDVDVQENGQLLAGASLDKVAAIFKLPDYSVYKTLSHPDYPYEMSPGNYVSIPPTMALICSKFLGNKLITAGGDRTVRSWDIASGKLLNTFTGHKGAVSAVIVSATGNQVASVDLKGKLAFWDLR